MPRPLDVEQRRRDIAKAARDIIADAGPSGLTLRAIADSLGGSITLVTHIYPTRQDLLMGLAESWIEEWDAELPALEAGATPRGRLRILLEWLLPLGHEGWKQERARILLIADSDHDSVSVMFDQFDSKMRSLIADHLDGLVPARQIPAHVDLLRVVANGIVLSTIEHPDKWPPKQQRRVLNRFLESLGLHE